MRARVGLFALVLLPGACFVSIDESLLDRADASGAPDGRADDGPNGDGGTITSDGGEGGGGGDADAASKCIVDDAGRFCDDFDVDDFGKRWSGFQINLGQAVLDDETWFSSPRSMKATLPPGDGTTERQALLYQSFFRVGSKVNF